MLSTENISQKRQEPFEEGIVVIDFVVRQFIKQAGKTHYTSSPLKAAPTRVRVWRWGGEVVKLYRGPVTIVASCSSTQ